ncbi:MAG TPA: DMT family transporter [Burkholderiales bacterium]|nr:DMT family transporter [Burkholderiales bacterium]
MSSHPFAPVIRAALWMTGALASFTAMAIAGRQLSAELTTFQILFFRSFVGLVVVMVLLRRSGWAPVKTRVFGMHLLRNVAHFGGQYGWFYGIALIPLTEVFAIEFTIPIWTAILATLFLGERMNRVRVAAVALGFVGILVILRPGMAVVSAPALAVLGGALCYAVSHIFTKRLSGTETPLTILFYMTLIQLPLGLAPALPHWVWPSAALWPWVGVVAVTALSAHYCLTRAFRLADATVVIPMDFLRLPLIAVVGFLFYGEPLNIWVFVGALIVFAATWLNLKGASNLDQARSRSGVRATS